MDDAQRAGIITEDDIPITLRMLLGATTRERLNTFVHNIVENSQGKDKIMMSPEIEEGLRDIRALMFQDVYLNPAAKSEEKKAEHVVEELYTYYSKHPEKMSAEYRKLLHQEEEKERVVCDYISGMTDKYAITKFKENFMPQAWKVDGY